MATDIGSIRFTIEADSSDLQRADAALDDVSSSAERASKSTKRYSQSASQAATASKKTTVGTGRLRGAMGQLGFQVQDVAVQLQSGTNAMLVFGQQGSQIASIFGPGGAVIGAILAVGSALAGAFFAGTEKASDGAEKLIERINELERSFDDLTSAQRQALEIELARQQAEITDKMREQRDAIEEAEKTLERYRMQVENPLVSRLQFGITEKEAQAAREEIVFARAEIDTLGQESEKTEEQLRRLINGFDDTEETAKKATESVSELVSSIQMQADTIGLSARETALYELERLKANGADEEAIAKARRQVNASFNRIEAYKQEQEQLKQLREQTKITAAEDPMLQRLSASGRGQDIIRQQREQAEAVRRGLDREFAIRQEHQERVMALRDGLRNGAIQSQEQFNQLVLESERQRNEQLLEINGGYWEKWLMSARDNLTNFKELTSNVIENFTTSFGDAFESVILDAKDVDDAFKDLARTIIRSVVNSIGQMAAQWLALQAVQFAIGTQTTAATVAQAGIAASAWAPAAAFASLATAGANAAPAAAGITATTTLANTLAFTGARENGGQVQPGESYLVGERGPEMFTPNVVGAVSSNRSMQGGGVTIINQTTGRIDKAEERRLPSGERAIIIQEAVNRIDRNLENPNSSTSRSLAKNTTARRQR